MLVISHTDVWGAPQNMCECLYWLQQFAELKANVSEQVVSRTRALRGGCALTLRVSDFQYNSGVCSSGEILRSLQTAVGNAIFLTAICWVSDIKDGDSKIPKNWNKNKSGSVLETIRRIFLSAETMFHNKRGLFCNVTHDLPGWWGLTLTPDSLLNGHRHIQQPWTHTLGGIIQNHQQPKSPLHTGGWPPCPLHDLHHLLEKCWMVANLENLLQSEGN